MAIVPHAADAQEIFQETAIALWNQIDRYDPAAPFTPWACRFAANKAKEYLRKRGRWNAFLDDDVAMELLARRQQIAPQLDRRVEPLQECLNELPTHNQSLIEKYYYHQIPIQQIADEIGRRVPALYKSLQRIRSLLLDCVKGKLSSLEASP